VDRNGREGGFGGACLRVGCIPSKALIELAESRERAELMAAAGLRVSGAGIDLAAFQDWKDGIVADLASGVESLLDRAGVRTIDGAARFVAADRVAVTLPDGSAQFLEFQHAIVATGSRPARLPGLEPDGERILTSTDVLALRDLPGSLAIVGAGYIGLELGTAFAKLGARVTIVEALDRALPSFPPPLTRPVVERLGQLGVQVRLRARAVGFEGEALAVETDGGVDHVTAERVVVATGRTPNTDELGLEAVAVETDSRGLMNVDERRLANERIAAIGDITPGPALAHKASAEAIVAADALSGRPAAFDPMAIPTIAFTDPEVASTGLDEEDARGAGLDVGVASVPLGGNGRAATLNRRRGFVRVVVDRASDRVVGVHIAAPHASELVSEGTLAVEVLASPRDLTGTIHPHPTLSEAIHAAAERVSEASPAASTREPVGASS
jgi:dihydrolipoamide dehydrogenase